MFSVTRTADSSHSDFDAAMAFVQLPAVETFDQAKAAIAGYFLQWNDTPYASKDEYVNIMAQMLINPGQGGGHTSWSHNPGFGNIRWSIRDLEV